MAQHGDRSAGTAFAPISIRSDLFGARISGVRTRIGNGANAALPFEAVSSSDDTLRSANPRVHPVFQVPK